jgi:hypothetical protein
MSLTFTRSDFKRIGKLLNVRPKEMGGTYRFEIAGKDPHRRLALEIYPHIRIGNVRGNLVSVYTETSHLQLHFCSGYVLSEMLGEVTFIGEHNGKLSGLIIEKEGGCSLYANVDRSLLSGDFTRLGPEVMLSGIALSLTDTILDTPAEAPKNATSTAKRKKKKSR